MESSNISEIKATLEGETNPSKDESLVGAGGSGSFDTSNLLKKIKLKEIPETSAKPFFIFPDEIWEKILSLVDFSDLKTMRVISKDMKNRIIPNCSNYFKTGCFIYDIKDNHSSDMIIQDWMTHVRFRNFEKFPNDPHSDLYKFFSRNPDQPPPPLDIPSKVWKYFNTNPEKLLKITTLELQDCFMHSTQIFDLIGYFKRLEDFIFIIIETREINNFKSFMTIECFQDKCDMKYLVEYKQRDPNIRFNQNPISTLKNLSVDVPISMGIMKSILNLMKFRCQNLESLSMSYGIGISETINILFKFQGEELVLANRQSLKKFSFKIHPEWKPNITTMNQAVSKSWTAKKLFQDFFEIRGLHLEEFSLELPMYYGFNCENPSTVRTREEFIRPLQKFLQEQRNTLKIVQLIGFGWFSGAEELFQDKIMKEDTYVNLKFQVIGGIVKHNPKWNVVKNKIKSLEILWIGDEWTYFPSSFIQETEDEPFLKTKSFIFSNHVANFQNIDLPFVLAKFPNLIWLEIINCVTPAGSNITINDELFQLILEKLPKLKCLHLDCSMRTLTDSGITGVTESVLKRMGTQKCYVVRPGDRSGFSVTNLRKIQKLVLLGLDKKVTNASVWLALRQLPALMELRLGSPQMSGTAKNFLRKCYSARAGFIMDIKK